jgi:hypothetical protein
MMKFFLIVACFYFGFKYLKREKPIAQDEGLDQDPNIEPDWQFNGRETPRRHIFRF